MSIYGSLEDGMEHIAIDWRPAGPCYMRLHDGRLLLVMGGRWMQAVAAVDDGRFSISSHSSCIHLHLDLGINFAGTQVAR